MKLKAKKGTPTKMLNQMIFQNVWDSVSLTKQYKL